MVKRLERLDIQSKIILLLIGVIVPTFVVVSVLENKLARPLLEGELKQLGLTSAESLANKIEGSRWIGKPDGPPFIENEIQELLYLQPNIQRIAVFAKDPATGELKQIASSIIDEDPNLTVPLIDKATAEYGQDEWGVGIWDVRVPIQKHVGSSKTTPKVLGVVQLIITTRTVKRLLEAYWKITAVAAPISVVILIVVLNFFLRKAILNERLLRQAEDQNIQLSSQLQEAQRQMMNLEKLAVMGQLTANFAHEIGTPLNAIGGHLQLLASEVNDADIGPRSKERIGILSSELRRIEQIVKGFLQTTAKPVSQNQLVDLNKLVDRTVGIVKPRMDSLAVESRLSLERKMGPLRVVPLEIEQILLNLVNNSLDSLHAKRETDRTTNLRLAITTRTIRKKGVEWAELEVYDTGMGISKENLRDVVKPFFTTKRPGEGTGLGLTISQQLAAKYGGMLKVDAKEGAWAKVTLSLPLQDRLTS